MAPVVIEAENPVEALARIQVPPFLQRALDPRRPLVVASDEPLDGAKHEIRWAEPLDRMSWHFAPRTVFLTRPHDLQTGE